MTNTLMFVFINLVIDQGPDHPHVIDYIRRNSYDEKFVRLANAARRLRRRGIADLSHLLWGGSRKGKK